jgi:hypothetical protein
LPISHKVDSVIREKLNEISLPKSEKILKFEFINLMVSTKKSTDKVQAMGPDYSKDSIIWGLLFLITAF